LVLLTDSSGNITTQTLNSNYTVSGTQAPNGAYLSGGSVTMGTSPAVGYTLSIIRNVSPTQPASWVDGDPDPAIVKSTAFDRATLILQRCLDLFSRSIALPDGFTAAFTPTLPTVLTPFTVLQVNETGTGWVAGPILGINETTFPFTNNTTAGNVTGLSFTGTQTRSVWIDYAVYVNTTGSGATELSETGFMLAAYKPVAGTWELTQGEAVGSTGVTFSINSSSGQVLYTSPNFSGTGNLFQIKFKARVMGV
jgi:hypothetical protein